MVVLVAAGAVAAVVVEAVALSATAVISVTPESDTDDTSWK